MLRRLIVAALMGACLAAAPHIAASACSGGGEVVGGGIDLGVECPGAGSGGGNGSGSGDDEAAPVEECQLTALECDQLDTIGPIADNTTDPRVLAEEAADRIPFAVPQIRMSPESPHPAIVNLETWLWLEGGQWDTPTGSVTAGDATVTATARPVAVVWNMGAGTVTCQSPGRVWQVGLGRDATTSCGYTYRRTSSQQPGEVFQVSAYVRYDVNWTCTGTCLVAGGSLGSANSPTATSSVRVTERQSVVVR